MSYTLEISLQKIAHVKIASILWNQDDIRSFVKQPPYSGQIWRSFEKKITENVLKLPLPDLLKEELSDFIAPIGMEIFRWILYHFSNNRTQHIYLREYPSSRFSWTPHGTIDRKETARVILESQTLDIATRYNLACFYCLECRLKKMRNNIREDRKNITYKIVGNPVVINEQNLADFWTYIYDITIYYEISSFEVGTGSYEKSFRNAVHFDNKVAAEYFLQKLTPWEQETCLVEEAEDWPGGADVLGFLLSQMDEEQLIRVFRNNPYGIMLRILHSPYTSFIIETASRVWDSLSKFESSFSPLTVLISRQVNYNYALQPGFYRKIFKELWECACKRFGVDMCFTPLLLSRLLDVKDKEGIELISRDVSPVKKREFILSNAGLDLSLKLVKTNDRELLLFFLRQCLSSEHDIRQYKNQIKKYALRINTGHRWRRHMDSLVMTMTLFFLLD